MKELQNIFEPISSNRAPDADKNKGPVRFANVLTQPKRNAFTLKRKTAPSIHYRIEGAVNG